MARETWQERQRQQQVDAPEPKAESPPKKKKPPVPTTYRDPATGEKKIQGTGETIEEGK